MRAVACLRKTRGESRLATRRISPCVPSLSRQTHRSLPTNRTRRLFKQSNTCGAARRRLARRCSLPLFGGTAVLTVDLDRHTLPPPHTCARCSRAAAPRPTSATPAQARTQPHNNHQHSPLQPAVAAGRQPQSRTHSSCATQRADTTFKIVHSKARDTLSQRAQPLRHHARVIGATLSPRCGSAAAAAQPECGPHGFRP